eukprot:TRINITY_DN6556_c0_g2_i3.p2 TRINITY_DN6556_c0_g2~~TRINITY_DN6556_c0_g2_i3.p2  ORF type:complete len:211 (-),score=50.56 TRINITY_DN6556_c0_g2_i3:359-991(-)
MYLGQRMSSQIAEHDGYFACDILALVTSLEDLVTPYTYPGVWEAMLLFDLGKTLHVVQHPDLYCGWDEDIYTAWRDSFGVGKGLWNDRDFGASSGDGGKWIGKDVEHTCGWMLMFEAVCPEGRPVSVDQAHEMVGEMMMTMFGGPRNPLTSEFAIGENKILYCNDIVVEIPPLLNLSGMSVKERVAKIASPVGPLVAMDMMGMHLTEEKN